MYQDNMTAWGATCQMSQGSILKMPHMTVSLNLMLKHDCLSRTTVILILQETIWVTVHETSNLFLTNLEVGRYSFTHFLQVNPVIARKRKAILFLINNITALYNHSLIVEECWKLRSFPLYLTRMSSKTPLLFTAKCWDQLSCSIFVILFEFHFGFDPQYV